MNTHKRGERKKKKRRNRHGKPKVTQGNEYKIGKNGKRDRQVMKEKEKKTVNGDQSPSLLFFLTHPQGRWEAKVVG